jgi:hypothetical protein
MDKRAVKPEKKIILIPWFLVIQDVEQAGVQTNKHKKFVMFTHIRPVMYIRHKCLKYNTYEKRTNNGNIIEKE